MAATRGYVVLTPTKEMPYKVVLEHEGSVVSEHAVATMREGEALIRLETPTAPGRDTSRDDPFLLPRAPQGEVR
jgi:hypothetical protein